MSIRRGDPFWVDLSPAKDSKRAGRRPAVVIQNDVGNAMAATVIVAPLTTKRFTKDYPFNVSVPRGVAGLREPSTMLFSQIRTIDKSCLEGRIGRLPPAYLQQANRAIAISLGLIA